MAAEIITKEDLALFKRKLIQDLHDLLTSIPGARP
jgi:hypothetical protein